MIGISPAAYGTLSDPVPVSSFEDGDTVNGKTFDELLGARGLTTIEIDSKIYALVASGVDFGVQIIDISDPANPAPVSSFDNGDTVNGKTYDELDAPRQIASVKIGSGTYALVANNMDGVQIIDITDPANPEPVTSFDDGDTVNGKTFDELNGAYGITTIKIGSSTYALVTAVDDNGVQIIDISDPANPAPVSSFDDGDTVNGKTYDELEDPYGITTVKIGSKTYALVAAHGDYGVQIIDISDPANPAPVSSFDDGDTVGTKTFDELAGAYGITTVKIGSKTYALVATAIDDGVQIIDISDPANPAPVSSFDDGDSVIVGSLEKPFRELEAGFGITTLKFGQGVYALVAAHVDDGVQIIDITNPANPVPVSSVDDFGINGELDGAYTVTTVKIDSKVYALVTGFSDAGVQIIDLGEEPPEGHPLLSPKPVTSFDDGDYVGNKQFKELNGARGITTIEIGSKVYALVAAAVDNGVQIIDVTNPTNPVPVSSVNDGNTRGGVQLQELKGANGITTIEIASKIYALVTAGGDNGVQIIDITNPASIKGVSSFDDGDTHVNTKTFDELITPRAIDVFKIGFKPYAIVASSGDNGVQIIDISIPQSPAPASSFDDGDTVGTKTFDELSQPFDVTTIEIGSTMYALVASFNDDGVQIINITDPANPAPVSDFDDGDSVRVGSLDRIFDELDGSYSITTVTIDSKVYALVAARNDNGVQIVDISDPANPAPVSSFDHGDTVNGKVYDGLNRPTSITTLTFEGGVYALVTAINSDGVQIVDITDPANPAPVSSFADSDIVNGKTFDNLGDPYDITTVMIGSKVYALVAAHYSDGVQIIDLGGPKVEVQGKIADKGDTYSSVCKAVIKDINPDVKWSAVISVHGFTPGVFIRDTITLAADESYAESPSPNYHFVIKKSDAYGGSVTVQFVERGINPSHSGTCTIDIMSYDALFVERIPVPVITLDEDEGSPRFVARSVEGIDNISAVCLARVNNIDSSLGWFIDISLRDQNNDVIVQTLSGVGPPTVNYWVSEDVIEDGIIQGKNSMYMGRQNFVIAKLVYYDADPDRNYQCLYDVGVDRRTSTGSAVTIDNVVSAFGYIRN